MPRAFPPGFRFGVATAAHQIEGGNVNNDWWEFEHRLGTSIPEPSGDACDSYHRYRDDVAIVAELGLDLYRFSVEWSRIEPAPGEFSSAALDHYRSVLEACHDAGVAPMVTLQHFTLPRWLAEMGGYTSVSFADRYARYCDRVARRLGDLAGWFCTLNEPNLPPLFGYELGWWPPGRVGDVASAERALGHAAVAHRRGVDAIKSVVDVPVGLTLAMADVAYVDGADAETAPKLDPYTRTVPGFLELVRGDDFLGVQGYVRVRIGPDGPLDPEDGAELTLMGYELWPQVHEAVIRQAWDATGGVPLMVTESGVAVSDDRRRIDYIGAALDGVLDCLDDGIDVRGYVYWSLLDNFEWAYGYGPTFGIVGVDRDTFARSIKPSGRWFGEVARARSR